MTPDALVNIKLPEPWQFVASSGFPSGHIAISQVQNSLEKKYFGHNVSPGSAYRNVVVQNSETGDEWACCLRWGGSEFVADGVTLMKATLSNGINGSDLRGFPIGVVLAQFTAAEVDDALEIRRKMSLLGFYDSDGNVRVSEEVIRSITADDGKKVLKLAEKNADRPLPKFDGSARFYALVGLQFEAIERERPGENTTQVMASINKKPLSTMQRWVSRSRKLRLLAPAATLR
ncbi:hypothetical protein [Bifidobacterium subtile]|jgi:hypothetical protein|uniref:hypothetical protein n=1 Tax=Bifidobacterium subtile TaxID=77635 RepID=UPI002F358101